ncbi:MAG TPA: hypothetical protein VL651_15410 [Bacteroidia bacterium]|nr:hypothetical protein [Bacteroidia bacterium]
MLRSQSASRDDIRSNLRYINYMDDKTIDKAKEAIRTDSTFYMGYMTMGGFMFYRANDELGYTQCVPSLEKAMTLLEKDFDKDLRTRTNDYFTFVRVNGVQGDYCEMAYWLQQAYQNIDQPDNALKVLRRVRDRDLQLENGIETFNTMAWIYHRNRMYTPESGPHFSFLKNTVHANDSMAYMFLDSSIINIQRNAELNVGIYDASYVNTQFYFVYHYKAILFDYNLELDSAQYYYDILLRSGYYSSNNYAEFRMAMGDFKTADDYFVEAEQREGGGSDKRTREYYYMRGTLDEYRAAPIDADSLLKHVIDKQGSSPGFGWHSIGLARSLYYEGKTAEAQRRINKAASFHELHISTTWGQEQYNLAVEAVNYNCAQRFEQEYYFENDQWYFWYNPVNWWNTSKYSFKTNNQQLILGNLVADDPERNQVIYPVFSSENLMNFDEVWSVIDGMSPDYFIGVYEKLLKDDKRPLIKKYYSYFLGKLYLSKGDEAKAKTYFENVLNDPDIGTEYNKLLYARTCEGMANCSSGFDRDFYTYELYRTFPQLVPYSGLKMKMRLMVNGKVITGGTQHDGSSAAILFVLGVFGTVVLYYLIKAGRIKRRIYFSAIPVLLFGVIGVVILIYNNQYAKKDKVGAMIDQLKQCKLEITTDAAAPLATVDIEENGKDLNISYEVQMDTLHVVKPRIAVMTPANDDVGNCGKILAYDLFNIHKDVIGDVPPAVNTADPKNKADSVK